jgi:hypothetical protein
VRHARVDAGLLAPDVLQDQRLVADDDALVRTVQQGSLLWIRGKEEVEGGRKNPVRSFILAREAFPPETNSIYFSAESTTLGTAAVALCLRRRRRRPRERREGSPIKD